MVFEVDGGSFAAPTNTLFELLNWIDYSIFCRDSYP